MRVVWSSQALRQVRHAYEYLVEFNPSAATRLIDGLLRQGDSLVDLPRRGRLVPGTSMRELVAQHLSIIRYEILEDEVWILRVRHGARAEE